MIIFIVFFIHFLLIYVRIFGSLKNYNMSLDTDNTPAHRACETIQLLQCETSDFIGGRQIAPN